MHNHLLISHILDIQHYETSTLGTVKYCRYYHEKERSVILSKRRKHETQASTNEANSLSKEKQTKI